MLTIGRFADATGLTVKALRHYDAIDLLRPAHVDSDTGYRYYDESQIEDAVAIRRLRALEMPLEEIRQLLAADVTTFRDRLAAHGFRVAGEAHDKHLLLLELAALVEGGDVPLAVEIGEEQELRLAALIRQLHQDEVASGIETMARTVRAWLREQGGEPVGPPTALYRSGDQQDWHLVEAGWPVGETVAGDERIAVRTYPSAPAARYLHTGDLRQLHTVAQRFIASVLGQGLRISQPIRIVFVAENQARLVWPLDQVEPD
jgi:DNA-binding transcriptional MerR regulator